MKNKAKRNYEHKHEHAHVVAYYAEASFFVFNRAADQIIYI